MRTPRSNSRMSMSSRHGGSRASDEDGKTAVKVGASSFQILPRFRLLCAHRRRRQYYSKRKIMATQMEGLGTIN
jgi:hypothetical protein